MRPRRIKPKTVNVAIPEALHCKVLSFADLFNLPVSTTVEILMRNGFKNIISVYIAKLKNKIELLEEFNMK